MRLADDMAAGGAPLLCSTWRVQMGYQTLGGLRGNTVLLDLPNFLTRPAVFRDGRKVLADIAAQQQGEA